MEFRITLTMALLALVIVSATVSATVAPWYQGEINKVGAIWQTWLPVASLACLVAFMFAGFAYMIAYGFDIPELKVWAKSEMYQAFASAVIVGSLVGMTQLMLDEGLAKILGKTLNPFTVSMAYFNDLESSLKTLYVTVYSTNFPMEALASMEVYSNASGITVALAAFLRPAVEALHMSGNYIVQALMLTATWKAVLAFAYESSLATFLPLGVFLRIFPFTRGAGALMIAIAIGFFIVFPTMFAIITVMGDDNADLAAHVAQTQNTTATYGINLEEFGACTRSSDLAGGVNKAEELANPEVLAQINTHFAFLPALILKMFFYPLVVMAVTITFIRTLAQLLGSEIGEIGKGIMRLI